MKKTTFSLNLLCISLFCLTLTTNAQEKELQIITKTNGDKSVSFTAEKRSPGTYTIVMNFKDLNNVTSVGNTIYKVKYLNDNFLTLNPSDKTKAIGYGYSYSYIRGELKPKFSPLFLYALPYAKGKKVRVAEASFFNATYFGSTTPEDWKSYHFYTEKADTVTAVRKGMVVSVSDVYDEDNKEVSYTSKVNSVIIEHSDGTMATYRGFKKGIIVKEGQTVFPGTALGVSGMMNERYGISLMLTYLKSVDFESRKNVKESKSLYGFITPYFSTEENLNGILSNQKYYTAVISPEIVQKEMSKKEMKNLEKK